MASIQLTEALLAQYLAYQRVLVHELDKTSPDSDWSGRFAFAHSHALLEARLDSVTYGKVKALVGDFCSHQTTLRQLNEHLERAKSVSEKTEKEQLVIARAERELPLLRADTSLVDRYGADAMTLLAAHGDEVLRLHREVARREGCTRA